MSSDIFYVLIKKVVELHNSYHATDGNENKRYFDFENGTGWAQGDWDLGNRSGKMGMCSRLSQQILHIIQETRSMTIEEMYKFLNEKGNE